jgi:hypothetical protein
VTAAQSPPSTPPKLVCVVFILCVVVFCLSIQREQVDKDNVPVSSLLALGAVHHYLVRQTLRSKVALVVACGDVSVIHEQCLSIGFGADAIFPYVVYDILRSTDDAKSNGETINDFDTLVKNFQQASSKGIYKVRNSFLCLSLIRFRP